MRRVLLLCVWLSAVYAQTGIPISTTPPPSYTCSQDPLLGVWIFLSIVGGMALGAAAVYIAWKLEARKKAQPKPGDSAPLLPDKTPGDAQPASQMIVGNRIQVAIQRPSPRGN